jgi:hypothetical protein
MTRGDRILIACLATLSALAYLVVGQLGTAAAIATLSGPSGVTEVQLSQPGEYVIDGRLGPVTVKVAAEGVRVSAAPCSDHTCVRSGFVGAGGGVIACVPNGVVVNVGGGDDGGIQGLDVVIR